MGCGTLLNQDEGWAPNSLFCEAFDGEHFIQIDGQHNINHINQTGVVRCRPGSLGVSFSGS